MHGKHIAICSLAVLAAWASQASGALITYEVYGTLDGAGQYAGSDFFIAGSIDSQTPPDQVIGNDAFYSVDFSLWLEDAPPVTSEPSGVMKVNVANDTLTLSGLTFGGHGWGDLVIQLQTGHITGASPPVFTEIDVLGISETVTINGTSYAISDGGASDSLGGSVPEPSSALVVLGLFASIAAGGWMGRRRPWR